MGNSVTREKKPHIVQKGEEIKFHLFWFSSLGRGKQCQNNAGGGQANKVRLCFKGGVIIWMALGTRLSTVNYKTSCSKGLSCSYFFPWLSLMSDYITFLQKVPAI